MSLRRLGLEQIDLFQLHRIDPQVPLADQVGELKKLQDEGKIVAIGLSQVTTDQLAEARQIVDITTVQSRYNLNDRTAQDILDVCERDELALIPWAPLAQGGLNGDDGPLPRIARIHNVEHRTSRTGLAARRLTQHPAHPRHLAARPPGRQPCRRRHRTVTTEEMTELSAAAERPVPAR